MIELFDLRKFLSLTSLTYALTMSPVALSLEELIPPDHHSTRIFSIAIRTALVISTLLVGLTIPFFGKSLHCIAFIHRFFSSLSVANIWYSSHRTF